MADNKAADVVAATETVMVDKPAPVEQAYADLWGASRGTVVLAPGADLTGSTGESWDAEDCPGTP